MVNINRVRILLRVSSNQQLETDGDLSIQRQLVLDYVAGHEDWTLDDKEYYEGSMSGYRNALSKRDVLQEALRDAMHHEYDILAAYKDDRIGRRMWEIGAYVMTLKSYGVDIYTVKDGCISPESDDILGQMMLALRYGNAQKSSSDTGMRVKDNAQKLVLKGKFMGGSAPYGYRLALSGEISKHGRALHKLEIVPQQADAVRYIYRLSLQRELGSMKIARTLNEDPYYKALAPNGEWKSGTITSILTNPIYAGYATYKRRERKDSHSHRRAPADWVYAQVPNREIQIIDSETWRHTQEKRKYRAMLYKKSAEHKDIPVTTRNDGIFLLTDVLYCSACGRKMTNATRYSYWTRKSSGEKRASKRRLYRCQALENGMPHPPMSQACADSIENSVLEALACYIEDFLKGEDISGIISQRQELGKKAYETALAKARNALDKIRQDILLMQEQIPDAINGEHPLSVEDIASAIQRLKEKEAAAQKQLQDIDDALTLQNTQNAMPVPELPTTWRQVFLSATRETQRIIINLLLDRIEICPDRIILRFKTTPENALP